MKIFIGHYLRMKAEDIIKHIYVCKKCDTSYNQLFKEKKRLCCREIDNLNAYSRTEQGILNVTPVELFDCIDKKYYYTPIFTNSNIVLVHKHLGIITNEQVIKFESGYPIECSEIFDEIRDDVFVLEKTLNLDIDIEFGMVIL